MNIIEAIKSGKPFRRKDINMHWIDRKDYGDFFTVSFESIVLDDWEVQEKTIAITESQFDEAWGKYSELDRNHEDVKQDIKKELGF